MNKAAFGMLWLLIFALPSENMFFWEGVGTISRGIGAVTLVLAFLSLLVERRFRSLGAFQVLACVFVLWGMLTFYWSIDIEDSKGALITLISLFIFIWLIWELGQTEERLDQLIKAYVLGSYVSASGILYSFMQNSQAGYMRFSATGFNANDLGLTLALGVPMAWYLALKGKDGLLVWVYRLYLFAAFFAIILTASRTSFIAMLAGMLFIILTVKRTSIWLNSLMWVSAALVGGWLLEKVPEYSLYRLSTTVSNFTAGDLGERVNIWRHGLNIFSDNPLLGTGIGTFNKGFEQYAGFVKSSHNVFLSILVEQGLVGLLIFSSILALMLFFIIKMPYLQCTLCAVLLFAWFLGGMTLGWDLRKPTWLLLGLIAGHGSVALNRDRHIEIELSRW